MRSLQSFDHHRDATDDDRVAVDIHSGEVFEVEDLGDVSSLRESQVGGEDVDVGELAAKFLNEGSHRGHLKRRCTVEGGCMKRAWP